MVALMLEVSLVSLNNHNDKAIALYEKVTAA